MPTLPRHVSRPAELHGIGIDKTGGWISACRTCPACENLVIELIAGKNLLNAAHQILTVQGAKKLLVWPRGSARPPCPAEVPKLVAEDFTEACLVLADSPKASAALSRRCLQNVLRETAKVKPRDLFDEIQEVLDRGTLPSTIADGLDAVRAIGNFGAHPIKSQHTGEVMPVEPGEAEWNLDILESLFDFYYVQPATLKTKKDALNAKLAEAKKPPIR